MLLVAGAGQAHAQAVQGPSLTVEAVSDYRDRGLSWSRGRPALAVFGAMPLAGPVGIEGSAMALRHSAWGGGGDIAMTLGARFRGEGALRLSGGATARLFPGTSALHYGEVDIRADHDLGPASFGVGISYAPHQRAIGGDNIHIDAGVTWNVPGMPLTVKGAVGHSSGTVREDLRAVRLRPGGAYADWRLGLDYRVGLVSIGLRYTDTSIGRDADRSGLSDRHVGARITGLVRVDIQ